MKDLTDYNAVVISVTEQGLGSGIYQLELAVPERFVSQAKPGMYCSFAPRDKSHQQRRPFSIVEAFGNTLTFFIKNVGPNSSYYVQRTEGDVINISNPRGQDVFIAQDVDHYVLAAGSIGAAPLAFLAKALRYFGKKITVLLGAKNSLQIVGANYFYGHGCVVKIITEEGPAAQTGLVTDLLKTELDNLEEKVSVVTCGPMPMMIAVTEMCKAKQIYCQLILETVFACNMGACMGCSVFMRDKGTKQICVDGPVFWGHKLDLQKLKKSICSVPAPKRISECDLSVTLKGQAGRELHLSHPSMGASGCQSKYSILHDQIDISRLGAIVAKGLSLYPSTGNNPPRVCETPSGMLNAIGLENPGLGIFLRTDLPALLECGKPIIPNIHGGSVEDYVEMCRRLDKEDVAAIELNFSCPNVKGGMSIALDKDLMYDAVTAVRRVTGKYLIVKMSPNVTSHVPIAESARDAGADAISLTNTILAMAIDIHTRRPKLANIMGGLSGPAIYPVSLRMVYQLYAANIGIPIIGVGGIDGADRAIEFLIGGALAFQIGTAGFTNSSVFTETDEGIEEYMLANGFSTINELSGSVITG